VGIATVGGQATDSAAVVIVLIFVATEMRRRTW